MSKGRLYIISGPSGSGKDTVLKGVFAKCPEIEFSISSITRDMRPGEVEGEKYHFISREEFEAMLKADELLEYNVFVGNYYGTPRGPVEECLKNGKDMLIEVDVNGARQIREKCPEAISVFIMPPSLEILKARLTGRGTDAKEVIEKRIKVALDEIEQSKLYDYIVVNDVLEDAIDDFVTIIKSDRLKTERQSAIINKVLGK